MKVRPVTNAVDLKSFISLPYHLHEDLRNWVPPLRSEEKKLLDQRIHPYHKHAETALFLAESNGKAVGRISATINHQYDAHHEDRPGFFGFFECVDDNEVSSSLIHQAAAWLHERGRESIRGPFNFSTNETCGLLVDGFDSPPVIMMPHNPEYYAAHLERAGLRKCKDLVAYERRADLPIDDRVQRIGDRIKQRSGVTIRTFKMSRLDEEVRTVMDIYNEAWADNWGFIPITEAEMNAMARELKPVLVPELGLIVESEGKPAGFSLTLPDINQAIHDLNGKLLPLNWIKLFFRLKRITRLRMITMGVKPEFRKVGLETLLYIETVNTANRLGYAWGEISWILEDNAMARKAVETMGAEVYKTYRIYEAPLPLTSS